MKTIPVLIILGFCTSMIAGQLTSSILGSLLVGGAIGTLLGGGLGLGRGRSSSRSYYVADTGYYGSSYGNYGSSYGNYGYQRPLAWFGTPRYVPSLTKKTKSIQEEELEEAKNVETDVDECNEEGLPIMKKKPRPRSCNRNKSYHFDNDSSDIDDDKDQDYSVHSDEDSRSTSEENEETVHCMNTQSGHHDTADDSFTSEHSEDNFPKPLEDLESGDMADVDPLSEPLEELESGDMQNPGNLNETDDSESTDSNPETNIEIVTQQFVKTLRKYGISQRQAAKLILKCSQSNLSEAISKAKRLKTSKNLSSRGMEIFKDMNEWLKNKSAQRLTVQQNAQQRMSKGPKKSRHSTGGRRGAQFSFIQLCVLVELYKKDKKPSNQRKMLISQTLGLDESQITTWFNNQRARNFSAEKQVEKMKKDGQQPVIPQAWSSLLN